MIWRSGYFRAKAKSSVPQPEPRSTTSPNSACSLSFTMVRQALAELGMGEIPVLSVNHAIEVTAIQSIAISVISNMRYVVLFCHLLMFREAGDEGQSSRQFGTSI